MTSLENVSGASLVGMPFEKTLPVMNSTILCIELAGVQLEQIQMMLVEDEWNSRAFGLLIWV